MRKSLVVLLALICGLLFSATAAAEAEAAKVLIFSGTTGYRHEGGDQAIRADVVQMLKQKLGDRGIETVYRTCNGMGTAINGGALVNGESPTSGTPAGCRNTTVGSPAIFTEEYLEQFDAVFFWQASSKARGADGNTNYLLNATEKEAFEEYVENGGGVAVGHGSSSFGTDASVWPWFDANNSSSLVGATMPGHGPTDINIRAGIQVADPHHPSTKDLPRMFLFGDEHYTWSRNVRGDKHVLLTLDRYNTMPGSNYTTTPTPSGHNPANMGADHPLSWCDIFEGSRTWVTGMGHFAASYLENNGEGPLMKHIIGGVAWAAGVEGADSDCGGTDWSNYQRTVLTTNVRGPIGIDIAKDGKVYWTEIGTQSVQSSGNLKVFNPDNNQVNTVLTLQTYAGYESSNHGVLGMALDPDFENNRYVYIYYSVYDGPTPNDSWRMGYNRVSRFTLNAAGTSVVPNSEQEILRVPSVRIGNNNKDGFNTNNNTAHQGGALSFDSEGNLYLGTGDDVDARGTSQDYVPMDQRYPGRFDARLTSANTNSLMGKILRIKPLPNASGEAGPGTTYEIPEGNMFEPGTPNARPEIYAMGLRNPFSIHADPKIPGRVVIGEYAHDASSNSAARGTAGIIEWNDIREPGFLGWPYCMGDNSPTNSATRYTWPSGPSGAVYDCSANQIENDAAFNDGLENIPGPAVPATIWRKYGDSQPQRFGSLGSGMDPITGPVYRYSNQNQSAGRWPAYWDGAWIYANMQQTWKEARVDEDSGQLISTYPIFGLSALGGSNASTYSMKFGPDGALYFVRWATNCCRTAINNGTHEIVKIEFTANDCVADDEDPIVTPSVSGNPSPNGGGAFANLATLSLSATDTGCSGVDRIEYSNNGPAGNWQTYNAANKPTYTVGTHTVYFRAVDNFGNVSEPQSIEIKVDAVADTTPPTLDVDVSGTSAGGNRYSGSATLTAEASDESGVGQIQYRVNGGAWTNYSGPITFNTVGTRIVQFRVADLSEDANVTTVTRQVSVVPAGSCQPAMSDEFDGGTFNQSRWSYRWGGNATPPALPTVSNGMLNFQLGSWAVDLDRPGPIHFIGQPLPEGDFTMEAKISAPNLHTDTGSTGTLQYAQVGLMIYQNNDHWAKVDRTRNADGNGNTHTQFESAHETGGTRQLGTRTPGAPGLSGTTDPPGNFWGIRIRVQNGQLSGDYTLNPDAANPTWNSIPWASGGPGSNLNGIMPPANGPRYVGLFGGSGSIMTQVDWVRVTPDSVGSCEDEVAPTTIAEVDPDSPDGNNGWYTSNAAVTLTAADDFSEAEDIETQWRLGSDGNFSGYSAPIQVVTDGEHDIQFRSIDEAGNVEDTKSVSVKVDKTAPTASHALNPASGPYYQPTEVTLTLAANDETSGLDRIEFNSGSGWQVYNPGAKPTFSDPGNYQISYRAFDNAGNVSAENSVSFTIGAEAPAALKISGKKKLTLKGKKAGKVKLTVANTGGSEATGVKICVKAPKKKVKTKKCVSVGSIAAGSKKAKTLSFKAMKKFVAKKFSATVKVTVTGKSGDTNLKQTYKIKLKKK